VNAIALPGLPADHFDISALLVLISLGWGEVLLKELDPSRLCFPDGEAGLRAWIADRGEDPPQTIPHPVSVASLIAHNATDFTRAAVRPLTDPDLVVIGLDHMRIICPNGSTSSIRSISQSPCTQVAW
jgi:hypothetical protein